MRASLLAECCAAFDDALDSQIGSLLMPRLENSFPDWCTALRGLRSRLEAGEFETLQDWTHDLEILFTRLAQDIDAGSDLGLCLLTVHQTIAESLAQILPNETKQDSHVLDDIINDFRDFAQTAPNSLAEFETILNTRGDTLAVYPSLPDTPLSHYTSGASDISGMTLAISQLNRDEDLEQIAAIVTRHEIGLKRQKGKIRIDLRNCQPQTIRLIREYLAKVRTAH
jgi:hypothetical protein